MVKCECGRTSTALASKLVNGRQKSCGCYRKELLEAGNLKHGFASRNKPSPEYKTWVSMLGRCHNAKDRAYRNYGARGIKVCDAWRASFENFIRDMGRRPSKDLTLDRIDNDGNYEPGNVRWATRQAQSRNRRPAKDWRKPNA